jgi:hypothetical protein
MVTLYLVWVATAYPLGKQSDRMVHGQRPSLGLGAVTTTSSLPHHSATVAPYPDAESFLPVEGERSDPL